MFEAVLGSIPVAEVLDQESLEEVITLEEKILSLRELFTADRTEASFHEVASGAQSRTEIIVSFLALLELVKQRILHADQDELFVEIRLRQHRS
jgi:segregation and condensation protein A